MPSNLKRRRYSSLCDREVRLTDFFEVDSPVLATPISSKVLAGRQGREYTGKTITRNLLISFLNRSWWLSKHACLRFSSLSILAREKFRVHLHDCPPRLLLIRCVGCHWMRWQPYFQLRHPMFDARDRQMDRPTIRVRQDYDHRWKVP